MIGLICGRVEDGEIDDDNDGDDAAADTADGLAYPNKLKYLESISNIFLFDTRFFWKYTIIFFRILIKFYLIEYFRFVL